MTKRVFILSSVLLLVLASFVLAAGSSTSNPPAATTTQPSIANTYADIAKACESKTTVLDRIKCRLENKEAIVKYAKGFVEEACRDDRFKARCEALYNKSASCYNQEKAEDRKKCFLKESGLNINAGGTFRSAPSEAKRNYVVLLLYELQERIEDYQEDGKITADQASSLIAKIVEIKKMILAGEARADIVVKINEFKTEYRSVMLGVTQ